MTAEMYTQSDIRIFSELLLILSASGDWYKATSRR